MATVDLKKTAYRPLYAASSRPDLVEVPPMRYLMIDGAGDPNTSLEYREAIEALYPIAYGLRSAIKDTTGDAYVVMPLEGLWWADDMRLFSVDDKSNWLWTAMICIPDILAPDAAADLIASTTSKKGLVAGSKAKVDTLAEGIAAQVLHIGPYAAEAPTIAILHQYIEETGSERTGKHHEIYLSDPRKADPARLRTIIRQPIVEA